MKKNVHVVFKCSDTHCSTELKVRVWPDYICIRMVPLDRPRKVHQSLKIFDFLNFDLECLNEVQSPEPAHTKIPPILLLLWQTGWVCTNSNLLRQIVPVPWTSYREKTRSILGVWVDSWQGVTHGPKHGNLKKLIWLFIYLLCQSPYTQLTLKAGSLKMNTALDSWVQYKSGPGRAPSM